MTDLPLRPRRSGWWERSPAWSTLAACIRGHPLLFGGVVVAMAVATVLESVSLVAFFPVFQVVLHPEGLSRVTGVLGWVVSLAQRLPVGGVLPGAMVLLATVMICRAGVVLLREWLIARLSGRVLWDVENSVLARYAGASPAQLSEQKQGTLLFDCTVAPTRVALLVRKIPQWIMEWLKVAAITVVLLAAFPVPTMVLSVVTAGVMGLLHALSLRIAYTSGKGRAEANAEQMTLLHELLTGMRHLTIFCTKEVWLSRFREQTRRYTTLLARFHLWLAIPRPIIELAIVLLLLVSVGLLSAWSPTHMTSALPVTGLFAVGLFQLVPSLSGLGRLRMEIHEALPNAERVGQALTIPVVAVPHGQRRFDHLRDGVVLDGVSFAYPGRPPVLRGLSVAFRKGLCTAIVGPSGSGKTTVLNLVLGLLEPSAGCILVDGTPLQAYDRNGWLRRIGFMAQEPFIFRGTVVENILIGRRGYSRQQVIQAATIALADEFIRQLPHGYETILGERGTTLSGGQQQRLAIARAVLGDPDLLVLDEATSALDAVSEQLVQQAIATATRHRTVILVAHGETMVASAGWVVVLNQGRAVEQGPPEQLRGRRGAFTQLTVPVAG